MLICLAFLLIGRGFGLGWADNAGCRFISVYVLALWHKSLHIGGMTTLILILCTIYYLIVLANEERGEISSLFDKGIAR